LHIKLQITELAGNLLANIVEVIYLKAQPRKANVREEQYPAHKSQPSSYTLPQNYLILYHESQTMRFSSAIIVAALASLISAIPIDETDAKKCPLLCGNDGACKKCEFEQCASINIFPEIDNMTHLHDRPIFSAQ
jgi:hypothetical protein